VKGIRVASSPWPLVEAQLGAGAIAVLPIGAASKEHGRHLPMDTDYRQAEWITDRLIERLPVVAWPTVNYGYYPVFVDYPGSISLEESTFVALLGDILDGIARAGARTIAVLNTGISTIAPLERCIGSRSGRPHCTLINVYAGPAFSAASERLAEQAWGGHADEIETSIMLAIDASSVDMSKARAAPTRIVRGLFNRLDPAAPNYSPDGVNGDPVFATRVKGTQLLDALLADVTFVLEGLGRD